jgi:site-specific DNA recombinase
MGQPPGERCAVYTRYSSDLQRPSSTEDQIRQCRTVGEEQRWAVLDRFIRSDAELSGQSLVGRTGLDELIRLAKSSPRPFDGIIIDDTSRLGRYAPDVLRVVDILENNGVFVYFAAQRLDSRNPGFRQVFTIFAMMDEQHVAQLAQKVHRGQKGRALKGYVPGGKTYGYKNTAVEDPTRRGDHGRPAVIGVEQRTSPEQAPIIIRIFQMYAAGQSYTRIAKTLNREGIQSPMPPRKGKVRGWCPSAIRELLLNEKYRGVLVWNRTKTVRNRETGRSEQRPRPQSEWIRIEVPEMRIVSEELWNAAREQNRRAREKHGPRVLGGMNRTEASRCYLLSGLMECGSCGRNITITSGKTPYSRYGCPNHRSRGLCDNEVTILQTKLEEQLISALVKNLLRPELQDELLSLFQESVNSTLENEARLAEAAVNRNGEVYVEKARLLNEAQNIAEAIAQQRISPVLSKRLAQTEARLSEIEDLVRTPEKVEFPTISAEELRTALREQTQRLVEILIGDRAVAKQELQKRIDKLILTPKATSTGWVLEVAGSIGVFARDPDAMLTNSLEGIAQHYTWLRIVLVNVVLDPSLTLAA